MGVVGCVDSRPSYGLWRSLVSASVWGTEGPGFESRQPDHKNCRSAAYGPLTARLEIGLSPREVRNSFSMGRCATPVHAGQCDAGWWVTLRGRGSGSWATVVPVAA